MASLGVTVLVCFLTLHCIGMASAERSRVSVEFAGSNHGVKGNIRIDGQTWFSFDKNTAFHTAREWYSQTSSNLFFVSSKKANGEDTYGHYNATVLSWSMSEGLKTDFTTEVRLYPKKNIVIFESKIAREGGIANTNFSGSIPILNFPSILMGQGRLPHLGYAYFHGLWPQPVVSKT